MPIEGLTKTDTARRALHLDLSSSWTAEELGQALVAISGLYDLRSYLADVKRAHIPMQFGILSLREPRSALSRVSLPPPTIDKVSLSRWKGTLPEEAKLQLKRIQYASPGTVDLVGLGAIVGHIKEFVQDLINRYGAKRQRALQEEKVEIDNQSARLKNAKDFVGILKELGSSDFERRSVFERVIQKKEVLDGLIEAGNLIAVESRPED